VDLVMLSLHGAMVADDCGGDMVRGICKIVGLEIAVGVEYELHCHIS